jgi:hypothetical protein
MTSLAEYKEEHKEEAPRASHSAHSTTSGDMQRAPPEWRARVSAHPSSVAECRAPVEAFAASMPEHGIDATDVLREWKQLLGEREETAADGESRRRCEADSIRAHSSLLASLTLASHIAASCTWLTSMRTRAYVHSR